MHFQLIMNNCKWIFLCKFLWFSPSIYAARYVLFEDITPVSVEVSRSWELCPADQTAIHVLVLIKSEDLQPFAFFVLLSQTIMHLFCSSVFKCSPLKCFITNRFSLFGKGFFFFPMEKKGILGISYLKLEISVSLFLSKLL